MSVMRPALLPWVIICLLTTSCVQSPPRWAYIDATGKVVIDAQVLSERPFVPRDFAEGLAAVPVDGRWGYIDKTGAMAIPPQFGYAQPFSEGLAVVTSASEDEYGKPQTRFGYIDKTGTYLIEEKFSWGGPFSEGLAAVCISSCRDLNLPGAMGFIDATGELVIEARFSLLDSFSEGLAAASADHAPRGSERSGYINRQGEFVVQPRFSIARPFHNGLAVVSIFEPNSRQQGFIDPSGRFVVQVAGASDFSERLAAIRNDGRTVFIDPTGAIALEGYRYAGQFSEGLAPAVPSGGSKYGYIDHSGEFVIEPQFGDARAFSDGLAVVCLSNCSGS